MSMPLTFSSILTMISPSLKVETVAAPKEIPRGAQISLANGILELPVKSFNSLSMAHPFLRLCYAWFGGRDSNPNSQLQRLMSCLLDDLRKKETKTACVSTPSRPRPPNPCAPDVASGQPLALFLNGEKGQRPSAPFPTSRPLLLYGDGAAA